MKKYCKKNSKANAIFDFEKTKKSVENLEKEVVNQRNNLNAIYVYATN